MTNAFGSPSANAAFLPAAFAAALLTVFPTTSVNAQKVPEKPGGQRSTVLFDKLCYEMVPDFASLEKRAAALKWSPVTGAKLQGFRPAVEPTVLKAWSFDDLGVTHQIAISQSGMDAQSKKDFPAFSDAQVYSCSLILPAKAPRTEVSAAMQKLMGRKPDESSPQGRLQFDVWSGEDKTRKVIIQHMGAISGGAGGLISVTLMMKK